MNSKKENINIERFLRIFLDKWYITATAVVLCLILAFVYINFLKSDMYIASTTLYVIEDLSDKEGTSAETTALSVNEKLANDYKVIAVSNRVLTRVKKELPNAVISSKNVSVTAFPDSRILNLSVTDPDPTTAAAAANAITRVLIEEINDIVGKNNIKIIDNADGARTVSMNAKIVFVIFILLGILIGLVISVIMEITDTLVKGPSDIEERFDLPIIGLIPKHEMVGNINRKEQK